MKIKEIDLKTIDSLLDKLIQVQSMRKHIVYVDDKEEIQRLDYIYSSIKKALNLALAVPTIKCEVKDED